MKKVFLMAISVAFAVVSCNESATGDDPRGPVEPADGRICINEISASEKKIEIYNSGTQAVDITGYVLTKDDEDTWTVPEVLGLIPGKGYMVYTCKQDNPAVGPSFGLSGVKGFKLTLARGKEVVDEVDNSSNPEIIAEGETYGRQKDGDGSWVMFSTGSLGAPNAVGTLRPTPKSASVYINEVDCTDKRIEFYNPTSSVVNLEGYVITKDDDSPWAFTVGKYNIAPKGFLVLTVKKDSYKNGPTFGLSGTKGFDLKLYCGRKVVDELDNLKKVTAIADGQTFGRVTDGGAEWSVFTRGTIGSSNVGGTRK